MDTESQEESAFINALLVQLLTKAGRHYVWEQARARIRSTVIPVPLELQKITLWLDRHMSVSRALAELPSATTSESDHEQITPGDVVDIPGTIDRLTVAISSSGKFVRVGSGGDGRSFAAERVRLRARI